MNRGNKLPFHLVLVVVASLLALPALASAQTLSRDVALLDLPEIENGTQQIRRVRLATPTARAAFLHGLGEGLTDPGGALRQARRSGGFFSEGVSFAQNVREGNMQLTPFAAGWMHGALRAANVNVDARLLGDDRVASSVFQAGVREGLASTRSPMGSSANPVGSSANPVASSGGGNALGNTSGRGGGLNPNPSAGSAGSTNNGGSNNSGSAGKGGDGGDEVGDRLGSGLRGVVDIMSSVITIAGGLTALTAEDGSFMGKLFGGLQMATGLLGGISGLNNLYGAFSGKYFLGDGFRKIAGYASLANTGFALFGAFKGALGSLGDTWGKIFGGGDDEKEETEPAPGPGPEKGKPPVIVGTNGAGSNGSEAPVIVPQGAGAGTALDGARGTAKALGGLYLLNCPTGGKCYLIPVKARRELIPNRKSPATTPRVQPGENPGNVAVADSVAGKGNVFALPDVGGDRKRGGVEPQQPGERAGIASNVCETLFTDKTGEVPPRYWKELCGKIALPAGVETAEQAKAAGKTYFDTFQEIGQAYFTGCARKVGMANYRKACGGAGPDGAPYWVHMSSPAEAYQLGRQQAEYFQDSQLLEQLATRPGPEASAEEIERYNHAVEAWNDLNPADALKPVETAPAAPI